MVRHLLDQGANRDNVTEKGKTTLHTAAEQGHLEIAKLLMLYGADLNARNNGGQLPIDVASNEEIKQAIRDEPRRRIDEAPGKRATEQDRHPNAATSASAQQEDKEEEVADEDQDSEPSSDEEANKGQTLIPRGEDNCLHYLNTLVHFITTTIK